MCVEVPLELVELRPDGIALARPGAHVGDPRPRLVEVSLLTLDEPVVAGDWVLAHAGFALHRISTDAARDALAIRDAPSIRAAAPSRVPAPVSAVQPLSAARPIREETP